MKMTRWLVLLSLVGAAVCASGQAMAEHAMASTGASSALSAPSKALNAANEKIAAKTAAAAAPAASADPSPAPEGPSPTLWEDKSPPPKQPAVPVKPSAPAVFVLNDGHRLESSNYFMTVNSLRLELDGKQRTFPMSSVNTDASIAASRERGIKLAFPTSRTQITISF
jgi:hypothetical protein